MRFSTLFFSAATLATFSLAQSTSGSSDGSASIVAPSTVTSSLTQSTTVNLTPAQSSQASCLEACPANDPNCRAKCIVVPEGDYAQQNRTIDCISECPQGNGTEIDNLNFENCQKGCVASATITPTGATRTGSGGSATDTGTATGGGAEESGSEASGTSGGDSASETSASPASTSSGSSADNVRVGVMGTFIGLGSLALVFGL